MAKPPNLLRKIQIEGQWKMLPVVRSVSTKGEVRYDMSRVLFGGAPMVATAGTFYLEYREDGRRVRRSVGEHPAEVKLALSTQASVIALRARGVAVEDAPQLRPRSAAVPSGKKIRAIVDDFVDDPPPGYRHKSYLKYRNALENFAIWADKNRKLYSGEIEREDVLAFLAYQVKQQELDVSTAIDKAVVVAKIFRDQGAPIAMQKGDWPKTTKRQREVYKPAVLKKLFAGADEDDYELFQFFLLTGMREREVAFFWWPNFDEDLGAVKVVKKPGFAPKNYEERTIPVHDELVELLQRRRERMGTKSKVVFPTSAFNARRGAPGGQEDLHLIRRLKRLVFRIGLNCGECAATYNKRPVTCETHPVCHKFNLHMFRHTYATNMLRDGVDLLSLQKLLGHKDLDSTKEYLRALEEEDLRAKVLETKLATRFI